MIWQYRGKSRWHDFDSSTSSALEAHLLQKTGRASYHVGRDEYEIDFTDMKQYSVADGSRSRRVRRVNEQGQDLADPLSNSFFFEAFQTAMRQAGFELFATPDNMFDFSRNRDYRDTQDNGHMMQRGGWPYKIPVGWKRFAVNVAGKYDGGDNTWMHMDGKPGEWAVAYHGTKYNCLPQILHEGLRAGPGQAYKREVGSGIYCTPDLATAEQYAVQVNVSGGGRTRLVRFILQCRVRPEAIRSTSNASIWVVNDPCNIRPYGVLVQ